MNVLFHVSYPLDWLPGGHAVQIRETAAALQELGVGVHWLHAEEMPPCAEILHYWTRPPNDLHWQTAKARGLRLVLSEYHQSAALRRRWTWPVRGALRPFLPALLGQGLAGTLGVGIYRACDAAIAVNRHEAEYMQAVFGVPPARCHVIPNGVRPEFRPDGPVESFDGLIYPAYICERKNSVAVARAAKAAQIPVKFVGGAVPREPAYAEHFRREVDGRWVFWEGEIESPARMAAILRGARGAFLASRDEGQGIALLEALACEKPVMGPDLPSLRSYYGEGIRYCQSAETESLGSALTSFYRDASKGLRMPFPTLSWHDIALSLLSVYRAGRVLG